MVKNLALVHFDPLYGPTVWASTPETPAPRIADALKKLMDASEKGKMAEYTVIDEKVKILHLPFEIKSPWARGKVESLMLAVVIDANLKLEIFQDLVKELSETLFNLADGYMAFWPSKADQEPRVKEKAEGIKKLLADYFGKLLVAIENANVGNILILGLNKAGKTTLLERMRTKTFVNTKPTLATNVIELILGNYKVNTIDVSGQTQLRKKWWNYTAQPEAIVYIVDLADTPERLQESAKEFAGVMTHFDQKVENHLKPTTPLLICGNKSDLVPTASKETVAKILDVEKYKVNYQIQMTSAKEGTGIIEGFKWLMSEFLKIA